MKTLRILSIIFLISASTFAQNPAVFQSNKNILKATGTASSKQEKINLENIDEWLCPSRLERGDREFGGHGPKVKSEVKLRLANNGTEVWADITFSAIETVQDFSTTSGKWSKKVFDVPYGKKIMAINSDMASRTQFISPAAGFQFLLPGQDVANAFHTFLDGVDIEKKIFEMHGIKREDRAALKNLINTAINNGNTVIKVPATEGTLVKFFHIVGDTGGDDISDDNNCNDDTRIVKIEFFPVTVTYTNR